MGAQWSSTISTALPTLMHLLPKTSSLDNFPQSSHSPLSSNNQHVKSQDLLIRFLIMYSPIVLSSLLILLLSHLSAALPQPKDLHLFTRDPPYDGARAGCHPSDYITSCAFFGQGASTASAETDAIAQATSACKATCWPALNGVSAADWDPKGCAVSFWFCLLIHCGCGRE